MQDDGLSHAFRVVASEDGVNWQPVTILRQRPLPHEEGEPFSDVRFPDGHEATVRTIGGLRTVRV